MSIVRYVAFYPPTGPAGLPWLDDAACDALAKTGRRVAEAFSAAVAERGLTGNSSEVRVFLHPAPVGQGDDVVVDAHLDFHSGFESAVALVPPAVSSYAAEARADVALRILAGVVRTLAPQRGWDLAALDAAEAVVRDGGLELVWSGPWKASPDRRREARGTFWLEDHGHGQAVIEVRDRGGDGTVVRSVAAPAFCTVAGFVRSARTLRWAGREVALVPSIGILGEHGDELRFAPDGGDAGTVVGRVRGEVGPSPTSAVVVTGSRVVSDRHQIRFVGGGPSNDVPAAYLDTLRVAIGRLEQDGLDWWSGADRALLEVTWSIVDDDGIRVRRLSDRVTVRIDRTLRSFADADPEQLARADVRDMLVAVTRRMGLGSPPDV